MINDNDRISWKEIYNIDFQRMSNSLRNQSKDEILSDNNNTIKLNNSLMRDINTFNYVLK